MPNQLLAAIACPDLVVMVAQQQLGTDRFPIVVTTGASDRAVVIAACHQARSIGVHVGMTVFDARHHYPAVRVLMNDSTAVEARATTIEHVLLQYGDQLNRERVDCWTMPLVALGKCYGQAGTIASHIQRELARHSGVLCRITLATSRVVARVVASASMRDTIQVVQPGTEAACLAPLPVTCVPLVGVKTAAELGRLGISTIGQLANVPPARLEAVFGTRGRLLAAYARGQDLAPSHEAQQRPHQVVETWTSKRSLDGDHRRLRAVVYHLVEQVGRTLRTAGIGAGRLTLGLGLADQRTIEHTATMYPRHDLDHDVAQISFIALRQLRSRSRLAVRSVRLMVDDLGPVQPTLFTDDRARRRQAAIDAIKARYGADAIQVAWLLRDQPRSRSNARES